MKLRLEFGLNEGIEFMDWSKDVMDFPKLLKYNSTVYEFVMYKKSTSFNLDYVFTFSQTSSYSMNFWEILDFKDISKKTDYHGCQCGAKFDRHNPKYHYEYCRLWTPKAPKK